MELPIVTTTGPVLWSTGADEVIDVVGSSVADTGSDELADVVGSSVTDTGFEVEVAVFGIGDGPTIAEDGVVAIAELDSVRGIGEAVVKPGPPGAERAAPLVIGKGGSYSLSYYQY